MKTYQSEGPRGIVRVVVEGELDAVSAPLFEKALFERMKPAARVVIWGHVGDGNLHVNLLGLAPDDQPIDHEILRLAADVGGTIAAEHGVGVAKTADLPLVRGAAELEAMRAVKAALDPRGILNPGVVVAR